MEVEIVTGETHQFIRTAEGLFLYNIQTNELTPCNTAQIEPENDVMEEVEVVSSAAHSPENNHLNESKNGSANETENYNVEKYDQDEFKEEIKLDSDGCIWTDASTRLLLATKIELGDDKSLKHKTKKKMLEKIAEIVNSHGYKFNATQVGNRIKTLERGFKRLVDNKKTTKTGRGKKRLNVSPEVLRLLEQMNKGKDSVHLTNIIEEDVDTPADVLNDQFAAENGMEDEDYTLPPTTSSASSMMFEHPTSLAETEASSSPNTTPLESEIVSESSSGPSTKHFTLRQGKRQSIVDQLKVIQKDRAEFQINFLQRMDVYNVEKKRSNDLLAGTNDILIALVNNTKIPTDDNNNN